ncbi:MAG TPA: nucleotide exchange factor GrpE [Mycobacteriales bacterium]|nr:nucleotide exchange factor GrpE [Mycobacteriales bacterium]
MSETGPMTDQERSDRDEPIVVHDKRRLDPETGEVRPEAAAAATAPTAPTAAPPAPVADRSEREKELLADLQRVTAEYANYRRRVDRDRASVVEHATLSLLESLLPVLDSVDLARQHGDLEGPFKAVGEALEQVAERQGLQRVGAQGDPFDPTVHHALVHAPEDATVDFPVVAEVLQPGWRLASGRVLRPAGVVVAEPAAPEQAPE